MQNPIAVPIKQYFKSMVWEVPKKGWLQKKIKFASVHLCIFSSPSICNNFLTD